MKKADTPDTSPPRKKMPAEVFVKIWGNNFEVVETEWEKWVVFDTHEGTRYANLFNVEVEGEIRIEGGEDPLLHLVLSNCHFPDCKIINAKARSITIREGSLAKGFSFENSVVGDFLISNSTIGNFRITKNSTAESFSIENSVSGDFSIYSSSVGNFVSNNLTAGYFAISNSMVEHFSFGENSQIMGVALISSKMRGFFLNNKCRLNDLFLTNSVLQRIQVNSESFVGSLRCRLINLQEPINLQFKDSIFGCLDFEQSVFHEFTTSYTSNCKINCLILRNFCNKGIAFFSNLKPLVEWEDFKKGEDGSPITEDGLYQFEIISRPSALHFIDSDLGNTQFFNCNLWQFHQFEFSNTKMLDVFVAGSQMPDDRAFCLPNDEQNLLKKTEQQRLAYGQFKKIYEAQGDVAGSLPYLAYEMEAYRKQLKLKKMKPRFSKKWWSKEGWDNRIERTILTFNRLSTNYGNNWHRGFWMTIGVMAGCFTLYCWALGFWFGPSWSTFFDLASRAPHYLNPFRDADSTIPASILPDLDNSEKEWRLPLARIIDYASRVIVAYFVYQTIQAFRKLGKLSG